MQKGARVLIISESHVRRTSEFEYLIRTKLGQGRITIDWRFRGGAHLDFAEREVERAVGYDMIVIMVGGNDIDSGTTRARMGSSYARIELIAKERRVKRLIIT